MNKDQIQFMIDEAIEAHIQARHKRKPKKPDDEYTEDFEAFWKMFRGRWNPDKSLYIKGSKIEAFKEWKRLSDSCQYEAVMQANRTGDQYTPDACRWLKKRMWEK